MEDKPSYKLTNNQFLTTAVNPVLARDIKKLAEVKEWTVSQVIRKAIQDYMARAYHEKII